MEMTDYKCNNCYNRHITSVALNWCAFCNEGLCTLCTEHHQASKILKYHPLIPISDHLQLPHYFRDIKNCCEDHEEPFVLYCQTHEQCCCISCVKETHNGCKDIETLKDVSKDVKSSPAFEEIETSLKTIIRVYDNIRENRIENKSKMTEQKDKLIAEVHDLRKSINDHLDNLVTSIETTISAEYEDTNLKIDEVLSEVEERQKNIRKLIEEEETIKRLSTDLQTFLGLSFFQDRIKEEREFIQNLKKEHRVNELDLVFQSDLNLFCEETESFGSVSVSEGLCLIDMDIGKMETAQMILSNNGVDNTLVSNLQQVNYPVRDYETHVTGCSILPTGQILIADHINNTLFMKDIGNQDDSYRDIFSAVVGLSDVTIIDNSKVAVTSSKIKEIVIIDFLMGKQIKTFPVCDCCWGVEFIHGNLLARCPGALLTVDTKSGNTIEIEKSNCLTCVTASNENIFGCKHTKGVVYCFSMDGEVLWQFQDEKLKFPRDLTTDNQGFVYVTGKESNNVIVISSDGKTFKEILNQSHGIDAPTAIHFEKTLGLLLVCNQKTGAIVCNVI